METKLLPMRTVILSAILILGTLVLHGQTKRIEDAIWWEIAEKCFSETGVENHNTLFLDIDNTHFAGSIYKKRLNSVGRMLHPILLFDYKKVAASMPDYPQPIESIISKQCSFDVNDSKEHQTKLVHQLLKESGLATISAEMFDILKTSKGTLLTFKEWGTVEFDKDEFEKNLQMNKKTDFAKETRNGERYVVLKSIWMKTIQLTFEFEAKNQDRLTELYQANNEILNAKGLVLDKNNLDISFREKYYPFCILGEITKIMGLKSFYGIVIEPDFNRYNNLIKYKSK